MHVPQRLFVTHDDGATWAPLRPASGGATSAVDDGNDRLFVQGVTTRARLDGSALVGTKDLPARAYWPPPDDAGIAPEVRSTRTLLCGGGVLDLSYVTRAGGEAIEVRSRPLRGAAGPWVPHPELGASAGTVEYAAAYGSEVLAG